MWLWVVNQSISPILLTSEKLPLPRTVWSLFFYFLIPLLRKTNFPNNHGTISLRNLDYYTLQCSWSCEKVQKLAQEFGSIIAISRVEPALCFAQRGSAMIRLDGRTLRYKRKNSRSAFTLSSKFFGTDLHQTLESWTPYSTIFNFLIKNSRANI